MWVNVSLIPEYLLNPITICLISGYLYMDKVCVCARELQRFRYECADSTILSMRSSEDQEAQQPASTFRLHLYHLYHLYCAGAGSSRSRAQHRRTSSYPSRAGQSEELVDQHPDLAEGVGHGTQGNQPSGGRDLVASGQRDGERTEGGTETVETTYCSRFVTFSLPSWGRCVNVWVTSSLEPSSWCCVPSQVHEVVLVICS